MPLRTQIQADLHAAIRAKDERRKLALRSLTAAVTNADIDARKELDDDAIMAVVQKQVKQRRESILEFQKGNRQDLMDIEAAEIAILEVYLPEQASREEVEAAARRVIAETGATGPREIGKVMPVLTRTFAGRADGRMINEIVRDLLGPGS